MINKSAHGKAESEAIRRGRKQLQSHQQKIWCLRYIVSVAGTAVDNDAPGQGDAKLMSISVSRRAENTTQAEQDGLREEGRGPAASPQQVVLQDEERLAHVFCPSAANQAADSQPCGGTRWTTWSSRCSAGSRRFTLGRRDDQRARRSRKTGVRVTPMWNNL